MSAEGSRPPIILLASTEMTFGWQAGYTALALFLPQASLIRTPRADPRGLWRRAGVNLLTRVSMSRWYRFGSMAAELRALRESRRHPRVLVHVLWGDRDLGFLDRLLPSERSALCATFHTPPDTLEDILSDRKRLRRLDALILMSEVQRPFFEEAGVAPERIHVVHHGVDCSRFKPAERQPTVPFTALAVGNYRRDFTLLRDTCVRLASRSDIAVRIVAPSDRAALFADLPNVAFESNLGPGAFADAYRDASCLLMTADAATANNAVLEAMASGLPIVSTDVGGVAEYVGEACAILTPPGSAEALARAVARLKDNPRQAESMRRAARRRAEELDWPNVAARTLAVYDALFARRAWSAAEV